ncbi:hypothetical protein C2E20_6751 [Micractinium conductrix]|uniref:Uncharacterized protein n=1 Tax=Micractinium conductrix TaxID=554055 RepID=A0A2P6V6W6_9CHLO|nr:hypothetical protein C2E20_6751 [Micractinium conductrix]|eukprot:PSC69829.1 hypothetical protein C2E20_6751 [Micractinium conductrix]
MQRYRQRQRQRRQEQQQQCAELASQLERARLEHQAAVSEHKALEAGHSLRDDWLEVLRLLREAQDAEAAAGKGAAPAAAPPGDSDARGGAEASHEALQLADWLEAAAGSGGEAAASGQYVPKLAPALASWLRASPHVLASVRALTPAQLFQYISALWDRVLERVTELLAMVDAAACKQAERQLTDLMVESCLFLDLVTLLRPNHIKLLMAARSMAPQAAGERGQHADWRDVVAALRLTPAQRRALRGEWQAFQARHSQLASAANAAAAGIATAAAPASQRADDSQHSGLPTSAAAVAAAGTAGLAAGEATAGSMAAHVEPYTRLAESAGELAAAADAHWAALLTFSDEAWYSLTPLQGARLLVACRPFYPDPIQLCMALQEEEAEGAGRGEIGPAQLGGAEAEEAGGGGIEAAAAWGWVRQAAERRDGSGALPAGLPPSSLLG